MSVFKRVMLGLLSFLLILPLCLFGPVLTVNSTALSPEFVTTELNKLDMTALVNEITSQSPPDPNLPPELWSPAIIAKVEPLIKEKMGIAIHSVYDYLLGKTANPNLAQILGDSILNKDLITTVANEIDITTSVGDFLKQKINEQAPPEQKYLVNYIDSAILKLEPWAMEQIAIAADPVVAYLLGRRQSLNVVISLGPAITIVEDTMRQAFLASPPPELANLPPNTLEQHFNQDFRQATQNIPSSVSLDETALRDLSREIATVIQEAERRLTEARQYVGYFRSGYILLIVLIALLILGIILVSHQINTSAIILGIIFLVGGAIQMAGFFLTKNFISGQLPPSPDMPAALWPWLPQVFNDALKPLLIFGIGLLVMGVVLVVFSLVYKPHPASA
ncbi:MAG: hypothetical protein PHU08_02025 [Dehalococcoidales bacterium]|nr:hypothetical protein [Dehalococcoidales bacterium]